MLWLKNQDLNRNQILNMVIQNLASAPSSPIAGLYYFDTALGHTYVYNGSGWEQASGGGGSGTVTQVTFASVPSWLTASVATNTTTPAITLSATSAQTANQVLATPNGSTGAVALRTLDHNWISDFDTQVRTSRLDQLAVPTAAVSLNSQRITNLTDPSSAQDAATKNYVDITIQGLTPKPTATVATTAALPANTYSNGTSGVGATITTNANGAVTVDGYTLAAGDIVLVKDESTGSHNGLFTVTQAGDASHTLILTRHVDMDTAAEFPTAFIPVEDAGTTNANSLWLCTNTAAPTVGTTAITFIELNKAADLAAGSNITISGNTVSLSSRSALSVIGRSANSTGNAADIVGTANQALVVNSGGTALAFGQVNLASSAAVTGTLPLANGGLGATTASAARTTIGAVGKYSALIGDGSSTSITVTQATHGLASDRTNLAIISDASTGAQVGCDVTYSSNGDVVFAFSTAPASNAYRITIVG